MSLMKILAIDDSQSTLSLIVDILSRHDYEVWIARNGPDGLKKYAEFRPDIVTVDLTMPEMDGYEVLRRIKSLDKYANVIMVTASEHSAALKNCLEEGALDFVPKPFTPKELVNAIKRASKSNRYYSRDASAFFSLLNSRLLNVFRTTFPEAGVSVELEGIRSIRNASQPSSRNNGMVATGGYESADFMPSVEDVSFITRITGEREGVVSSFVKAADLNLLFQEAFLNEKKVTDNVMEFFNTVNTKVISELSEATHLQINGKPVMFFSTPSKMTDFWNETIRMWDMIEMGLFRIRYHRKTMPLQIQVWYDGEMFA